MQPKLSAKAASVVKQWPDYLQQYSLCCFMYIDSVYVQMIKYVSNFMTELLYHIC